MSRDKRSRTFVDTSVQGALARRIIYHWLVFLVVASATALLLQVLSNPFQPLATHIKNMWWTHGPFLVVLVFLLPVFVVDTVKISHRFAGPMMSLDRAMREVAAGQPPRRLAFRQDDYWKELADDYNAMLERLAPEMNDEPVAAAPREKEPVAAAK